jgi:GNAT superfamily N-acetyltransferase
MAASSIESQNPGGSEGSPPRPAPEADPLRESPPCEAGRGSGVELEQLSAATPAPALAAARELLLEYGNFVLAQSGAARFCFGTLRQEAEALPASFIQQGGGSLLAFVRGQPAGFVAWRALNGPGIAPNSWELKRLWVRPVARGLALGRRLTQAVLDRARAAGRNAIYLDTAPELMASAHRLYLEMGFVPCLAYNDNPVEGLVWMVKFL